MCVSAAELSRKMALQIADVNSDFNRWVTGLRVGHNPSYDEAFWHWFNNGGRDAFNERWNRGDYRAA